MNFQELQMLKALPLEIKIVKSKLRIQEWVDYYGENGVYISFSGGKDRTVLLHLVRSLYPNIKAVFCDTGLEYPSIKEFVNNTPNVEIIRPKLSFKQVIEKYGYPVISKEQSHYIYIVRNTKSDDLRNKHLLGVNKDGSKTKYTISKKWRFALQAPFKISDNCCEVMKKRPFKSYEKKNDVKPFIGTLTEESILRQQQYLKHNCNSFKAKRPTSTPLSFWTEQDILEYLVIYNIPIAEPYGKIIKDDKGLYTTSKCKRTGCTYCLYGINQEQKYGLNRLELLKDSEPLIYDYCMNKLGFKEVCDFMGIRY